MPRSWRLLAPGASSHWLVLPLFAFTLPFFLAGRTWRQRDMRKADPGPKRWQRRGQRPWRGRRLIHRAMWISAFLALIAFMLWQPQTYAYQNKADFWANPGAVSLMFLGAISATILTASLLIHALRQLAMTCRQSRPGFGGIGAKNIGYLSGSASRCWA